MIGHRLGPYTIVAPLGAGGMGEVYRAHDSKLGRDVAIKILPAHFTADPERRSRFAREARLLATLNHPNIGGIYGLEETDGVTALVLELVEGPTLADRLARGRLPIAEALAIARQIAAALDAAHQKGIVHRDLKPSNIVLQSADGVTSTAVRAKVLDFGLAKAVADQPAEEARLPTVTGDRTGEGKILGTPAYMSPEQARGQSVDKRTDIWAFGCVVYEMLTSRRAFAGATMSDQLAAILEREPDWTALPPATPSSVRRLLTRCLEKDQGRRLRDIGDARLELDEKDAQSAESVAPSRRLWPLAFAAALLAGAALGWVAAGVVSRTVPAESGLSTFVETLPDGRIFEGGTAGTGSMIALSPNGRMLAYVAEEGGQPRLFIRPLDRLDQWKASPIAEPGAREPFFSPDGEWIGFRVRQTIKRASLKGGPAETIGDLPSGSATVHGISWNSDGTILVGAGLAGLVRMRSVGGGVETLAKATKGGVIMYPQALPGGRAVLYTETAGTADSGELMLLDVGTGKSTRLRSGSAARYLPTGHLVFISGASLLAVAFDLDQLQMYGAAVPILTGIRVNPEVGAAQLAFSDAGGFGYLPVAITQRTLVWVDRQGKETAVGAPPRAYSIPRVAPDGTRVAVSMKDGGQDIYLWDVSRRLLRQLTFDASPNTALAWLDNERLAFSATVDGWGQTFEQRADGLGEPRQVTSGLPSFPSAVSRDGALLIVREYPPDGGWDIGVVPLKAPETRQTVERTKATETNPALSPDGRWLAYQSNKTGRSEVYVRPLPLSGTGEIAVTAEGATRPVWARDGSELYYWTASRTSVAIKAIRIASGPPSSWGAPRVIVEGAYATTSFDTEYDVWEGRFLLMKDFSADGVRPGREIVVVQNWLEELGRLVPVKQR